MRVSDRGKPTSGSTIHVVMRGVLEQRVVRLRWGMELSVHDAQPFYYPFYVSVFIIVILVQKTHQQLFIEGLTERTIDISSKYHHQLKFVPLRRTNCSATLHMNG